MTTAEVMTRREASEYLRMSESALAQMAHRKTGPRMVRFSGRAVRYRKSDLDAWIEASVVEPEPAAAS
jgi:excisionase family DNA binding protein